MNFTTTSAESWCKRASTGQMACSLTTQRRPVFPADDCGRPLQIRTASTGVFLGCSGYNLPPKERCKKTVNLTSGDEAISVDADDEAESRLLLSKRRCGKCHTAMDSYLIDESRKLHVCGNNPRLRWL